MSALATCIGRLDAITKANIVILKMQISLKERLLINNAQKEQKFHELKAAKRNGKVCH